MNQRPVDLIPVTEARNLLRVSPITTARLLKDGSLRHYPDLLDRRLKLVSKGEVLAIRQESKAA